MAIRKNNTKNQICPLLDRECLKEQCKIYHTQFERCHIDLITANIYSLTMALKNLPKQDQELKKGKRPVIQRRALPFL